MTEKTIEIGVVTVPTEEELEAGKVEGTGRFKPTFRKLLQGGHDTLRVFKVCGSQERV